MTTKISLKPQNASAQDWAKAIILLGMGIYFIWLIANGKLSNYINIRFEWLSYLAAGLFVFLGGWHTYTLLRRNVHMVGHGASHLPITWTGIVVVGMPLIFATLFPSQPLGADAISGDISLEPIGGLGTTASLNIPPAERNVLDWLREFDAVDNPAELNDLPVDIVAFVYREPDMSDTQFMAARFTLSCCVADAFAIGMPVEFENAPDLEDGAWVRIQGYLQVGQFRGDAAPIIIPEIIEPTDIPENPYLYS